MMYIAEVFDPVSQYWVPALRGALNKTNRDDHAASAHRLASEAITYGMVAVSNGAKNVRVRSIRTNAIVWENPD